MLFDIPDVSHTVEIQQQVTSIRIEEWLQEDVFHFRWWLLLILHIVYIITWWKMADKKRLPDIVLYAALTTIAVMGAVEYGDELSFWDYPTDIIPIFPPLTAVDLASLPVFYSLIFQYFKTWKSFIYASLVMTVIYCLIIQPLMALGGLYQLLKWRYYYGIPVFTAIAVCIRVIVIKVINISMLAKKQFTI